MNRPGLNRRQWLACSLAGTAGAVLLEPLAAATLTPPTVMWTADLKSPSYGGGALGQLGDDLALVFGTYFNDEHLYALRAKDGQRLWQLKSEGGPFDAGVAIADLDGDGSQEVLAADSSTGSLFCVDTAGAVKWRFKLPNSTDSPPAVADLDGDGRPEVVVGTMARRDRQGRVIALNPRTQKVLWETSIPGHVQSEPALTTGLTADGVDVIVTNWRGDKTVRALSGRDGKVVWTFAMQGDMYHGVSVLEQRGEVRIVAASTAGDLALLNAKGQPEWTRKPGGYLFAPSSVADINGDGATEIIVCSGRVHVYSLSGEELWRSPDYQSISRGVAVVQLGGRAVICCGSDDRYFRVLEGASGKEVLRFNATVKGHVYEGIDSGPIVADFDGDGQLEAFFVCGKGTSDQTRPQNYGRAFAVKLGPGQGSWPMFRGNLRRTGRPD